MQPRGVEPSVFNPPWTYFVTAPLFSPLVVCEEVRGNVVKNMKEGQGAEDRNSSFLEI
jgi:hypothetical protein